ETGRMIEVNDSFSRVMGFNREESIGKTSLDLGILVDPSVREEIYAELRETGRVQSKEFVCRTRRGKELCVHYSAEMIHVGGRNRLLSVCVDITERKRADNELRRLSGQLLRLQDEERRKIARDLHDSTGQELVALTTMLSQMRAAVPVSNRKLRKLT